MEKMREGMGAESLTIAREKSSGSVVESLFYHFEHSGPHLFKEGMSFAHKAVRRVVMAAEF